MNILCRARSNNQETATAKANVCYLCKHSNAIALPIRLLDLKY
jgi:hypothetical protein